MRVSIDAMESRNDAIRGQGNFKSAIKALETYYAVGFEPKVLITVTSQSLPDLEELLCFLAEKNFNRINLNFFRAIGRGEEKKWGANPHETREVVKRAWKRSFPNQPPLNSDIGKRQNGLNCGVGLFINIMPNGDVPPCHVLTQPEFRLGNIKEQSLL